MLTAADIALIKRARDRLTEIETRLERADGQSFHTGRLAEACRAADDALLQILIVGKTRNLGVTDL